MWKSPGYAAWLAPLYKAFGDSPDGVFAFQAVVLPPFSVGLTWALGRTLFSPLVGVLAAGVVAVYPNAWQFEVRLFSEALATPLTTLLLIFVLGATAITNRRAAAVGVVLGILLLLKPSSVLLAAPIAVMWWARGQARTGTLRLAVTLGVAALVIAPWAIRNYNLDSDNFVPLSVQSAASYGVFNDDAANDSEQPWAWRPVTNRDRALFESPRSEGELYSELNRRTREYIRDHPSAVPKAFFYNGLLRTWDLQTPGDVVAEAPFQGRTKAVTAVGLAMYWPLLVLAIAGVVLLWRDDRRALAVAVVATALALSVVHTSDASTRYRAPFEPLIVVLATSVVASRLPAQVHERLLGSPQEVRTS
jgi:hypothetical protein